MVLEIIPRQNAASSKAYYATNEPALSQEWHGQLLDVWGVDPSRWDNTKAFNRLIDNRHPETGERVTQRQAPEKHGKDAKGGRVCAWDICVNVPKAVTLLRHFGKRPDQIVAAVKDANQAVMEAIEGQIETRVRAGGRQEDQVTGNGVWRSDYHQLARPVEGTPFPHDHIHNVLMNMTHDGEKMKAAKVHDIMRHAPDYQKLFHERLRSNLGQIGFKTKGRGLNWTIEGVPKSAVKKMSPRRGLIEKWMEGRKAHSGKKAALATREPKLADKRIDLEALKAEWQDRLTRKELKAIKTCQARPKVGRGLEQNKSRVAMLRSLGNHIINTMGKTHGTPLMER